MTGGRADTGKIKTAALAELKPLTAGIAEKRKSHVRFLCHLCSYELFSSEFYGIKKLSDIRFTG
jgi:hypothetical protein